MPPVLAVASILPKFCRFCGSSQAGICLFRCNFKVSGECGARMHHAFGAERAKENARHGGRALVFSMA
jgi:hypothetical protein